MNRLIFFCFLFFLLLNSCIKKTEINQKIDMDIEIVQNNITDNNTISTANIYTEEVEYPYILEPGKYYLNDYELIYEEPNYTGLSADYRLIEQIKIYDEIEIIEHMGRGEDSPFTIVNWYKIKYKDIEGYITIQTYNFDIDNNGIEDYFFYKLSRDDEGIIKLLPADIFIYINNKRISVEKFEEIYLEFQYIIKSWDKGRLYKNDEENKATINILCSSDIGYNGLYFELDRDGIISFIKVY